MPKAAVSPVPPDQTRPEADIRTVRPISASLGVNEAWQAEQPAPLEVPAYRGVRQISQMALMFTLWSRVEGYLYGDCQIEQLAILKDEKKHLGILRESETSVICLLCLLNDEPYTAGGLVDAMIGQTATIDQRGNARKRLVTRTLPVIADRYGLLQFRENNKGNLREYSITRSARLSQFAERHLVTGVEQIIGGEFTRAEDDEVQTQQSAEIKQRHCGESK